jgi:hypothetical protein
MLGYKKEKKLTVPLEAGISKFNLQQFIAQTSAPVALPIVTTLQQ